MRLVSVCVSCVWMKKVLGSGGEDVLEKRIAVSEINSVELEALVAFILVKEIEGKGFYD